MDRLRSVFAQTREVNRACFIAYVCAGDPDTVTSLEICRWLLEAGVDILELGVPFSDPLADGLTNQLAAQRALEAGMTPEGVFALVRNIREFSAAPIVLYTYYNLVFVRGEKEYAAAARAAGVDGVLVLDLPPEESAGWLEACRECQLQPIYLVAPTTPPERLPVIVRAAGGFVYYVSREGVTGERASVAANLAEAVEGIRRYTQLPVAVGFGISQPEHVRTVARAADGVVVGSALVNVIAQNLHDRSRLKQQLTARVNDLLGGVWR